MQRSLVYALFLVAIPCVVPISARADSTPTTAESQHDQDCARARAAGRLCELTIDGDDIEAGRVTSGTTAIAASVWGAHDSLIRLRRDFITEILKSAADLD